MRAAAALFVCLPVLGQTLPVTGVEVPELAVFDRTMTELITKYRLPGGSLAVVDRGRLVLARGYGFADRENNVPAQPFSLYRVASLSKTVTAVTTLKLVQEGKLRLEDRLLTLLPDLTPPPGVTMDARYRDVTIQQLLQHSFGSDSGAAAGDPAFRYLDTQRAFQGAPHSITNMVRFGIGLPLQFTPGTRYAYSNLGYHLLGRVIEKVTGKSYETYVREEVLAPMGISTMRIGRPTEAGRFTDEVKYYDFAGAPTRTSLLPGQTGNAPRPYGGGFLVDICESYGGWIASAVDLMRYVTALDGRRGTPATLGPEVYRAMTARPSYSPASATTYYGLGWQVRPVDTRFNLFHSGSLPGTRTYLVSYGNNGRAYAALFNMRPPESEAAVQEGGNDVFLAEVDRTLGATFGQVARFPERDLFPLFARETLNTSAEELTFFAQQGAAMPAAQTLNLTSSGASIFAGATVTGAPWLRLSRSSGYTPVAVQVTADPAGLAPGVYTATINLNSTDARNAPRTVRARLTVFAAVSARNGASLEPGPLAPGALAVVTGSGFGEGTTVRLGEWEAPVLERTASRLSFVVPAEVPAGPAVLAIRAEGFELRSEVMVETMAPGLFSADRTGKGAALASVVTVAEDGAETLTPAYECATPSECVATPIEVTAPVLLRMTATGLRNRAELSQLAVKVGDLDAEVVAAGAAEGPGEDVLTIRVPAEAAGRGELDVVVSAGERRSNAVKVAFR